jgi:hypothetical protein
MRKKSFLSIMIVMSVAVNLLLAWQVLAGSPDSPGAPGDTSSFRLEDLYQRLNTGAATTPITFTEPSTAPGAGTMHTLNEIMAVAPALDNTNGATRTQVAIGATYWGLRGGAWGLQTGTGVIASGNATDAQVLSGRTYSNDSGTSTGTMPNNGAGSTIVPTTTNQSVAAGYWSSANTVQGDADLVAANIKSGVNLFGVDGTLIAGSTYNAGVPKTGQTTSSASRDDGDLERGVAWPTPRFIIGTTGVVTDTLTGLIWLRNANCPAGLRTWATALGDVAQLNATGTMNSNGCGDTSNSGSHQTDWRLPNVSEMHSLIHYGVSDPVMPDTNGTGQWTEGNPFSGVQSDYYWSSSTDAADTTFAWYVYLRLGSMGTDLKTHSYYVWPVRGGQ